ncbi:MAG: hypothetical protein ACE5DN_07055 [Flavobacteriales bacterium]
MKRYSTWIALVAMMASACGGPCDYDIRKFSAEVKEIRSFEESEYPFGQSVEQELFHVVLEFDQRPLSESPQFLDELEQIKFDSILLDLNHIQVGNIYSGTISVRTSGHCKPLYVSFNHGFKKEYK